MKFSADTARLVEGRWYWCSYSGGEAYRVQYDPDDTGGYLWGDECPAPTVEVEAEAAPALLPCPFCGGAVSANEGCAYVECVRCRVDGPWPSDPTAAIAAWNTRAAPPAPHGSQRDGCIDPRAAHAAGYHHGYLNALEDARNDEVEDMPDAGDSFDIWLNEGAPGAAPAPAPVPAERPDLGSLYAGIKIYTDPSLPAGKVVFRSGDNERRFRMVDGILVEDGAPAPGKPAPAEPSPPAWVPPVCPAGQFFFGDNGLLWQRANERPLMAGERFPPPAWPPRIGEHIDVDYSGEWVRVPCQSASVKDHDGRWFVMTPFGRVYQDQEGRTWRWVYRDLSGYVPPGGAP
jgi:hypothetical protein